ncbi:hypothetical protein BDW02DRAFT_641820 [Decorospora gaudefroyi]|uniref:BRCT domain-containing protein n=1 Tax=Decorospora gaudefroyi TaxID=184978 RepID=A0A6A5K8F7_9PLEO|nr:hypothetical protein BDW02DRAFT_641820 [Decorospora gaudefroyi]
MQYVQYEAGEANCAGRRPICPRPLLPNRRRRRHHVRLPHSESQQQQPRPRLRPQPRRVRLLRHPASRTFFDPWNSSSTGHQRAENRLSGSTSWRLSRNLKLGEHDGRKVNGGWERGANNGLRTGGQNSLAEVWGASKAGKKLSLQLDKDADGDRQRIHVQHGSSNDSQTPEQGTLLPLHSTKTHSKSAGADSGIFTGLCFYINGSTAPLVSDHKLKQLLAAHGARHSITLGRRTVMHVVLGVVNTNGGAGGGLASSKIQKEISRSGGKAVKFVTAEWYVLRPFCEHQRNRRVAESRYSPLKLAPKSQNSVFGMMRAKDSKQEQG